MSDFKPLLEGKFHTELAANVQIIRAILEQSVDLIERRFVFHAQTDVPCACFYTDGLINAQTLQSSVLKPLMNVSGQLPSIEQTPTDDHPVALHVAAHLITNVSLLITDHVQQAIDAILIGETVLLFDTCDRVLIVNTRGWEARSIEEPQTESVVRGPRDGFTENIRTNSALIRRRLRDPLLRNESMKIGLRSKTDVEILYIKDTVKDGLVEEVKRRLNNIKVDGILESGYLEEFIEDAPLSPFTTVHHTERPDKAVAALLEGRVVILTDNTPFALMLPVFFWQYFQAADDYYSRFWAGTFFRLIRYVAFLISLTLPSLYVMLVTFHHEMIPTPLALSVAAGRESVPFPAFLEALIMEAAFELIREAGLRLPRPVGQAVSIVGSLVIGQAAVQAGLVSPTMVIIVAITGISTFAIPNYAAAFTIRLLRFPLLIGAGTLGLLGFVGVFAMLVIHTLSLRSFGESYLAPATPFRPSDQKDIIIRMPLWRMNSRPSFAENRIRMGEDQMPKPPEQAPDASADNSDAVDSAPVDSAPDDAPAPPKPTRRKRRR